MDQRSAWACAGVSAYCEGCGPFLHRAVKRATSRTDKHDDGSDGARHGKTKISIFCVVTGPRTDRPDFRESASSPVGSQGYF